MFHIHLYPYVINHRLNLLVATHGMYILFLLVSLPVGSMCHHIRNFVMHLAHFVFHHHHYTNEVVLCSQSNQLPGLMFQNILVMVYVYNLRLMHLMVYRLRIMGRKLKLKLQNKSFRFVLGLAIDYMCVCVCVCRFLRVSADLSTFVKHKNIIFLLSYMNSI